MSDFLADMLAGSQARDAASQAQVSVAVLQALIEARSAPAPLTLDPVFSLIAEIKGRSPAEGQLADAGRIDRVAQACAYADGGASAISVLTEPDRFDGELAHLKSVADGIAALSVPAMRKDFLCSEYQLIEAAAHGAGGALLITAMLGDKQLTAMLDTAGRLSLFVLLECFDADDIRRSLALLSRPAVQRLMDRGQFMLGVNTRNLRTLAVDDQRLATLVTLLPIRELVCVAESGLSVPDDAARARDLGYRAALIGTALMRSESPQQAVQAFVTAGRNA